MAPNFSFELKRKCRKWKIINIVIALQFIANDISLKKSDNLEKTYNNNNKRITNNNNIIFIFPFTSVTVFGFQKKTLNLVYCSYKFKIFIFLLCATVHSIPNTKTWWNEGEKDLVCSLHCPYQLSFYVQTSDEYPRHI